MSSFFDDIPIKLVALAVGLLLWFHVVTERVYNYEVPLAVTEVALDQDLTLSRFPPDSVTVIVSATGKQLLRTQWRNRGLKINATQLRLGRHNVSLTTGNVSLQSVTYPVSLDEVVYPTSIELYVDRVAQKDVPVSPDLALIPDEGFAVASVSDPSPAEISVTGARSVLGNIKTVMTEKKELTGLRNDLTLMLPLARPPGYGIRLEPDSVTLSIEVAPIKTRLFESVPIVLFNVPMTDSVSVEPARVDVTVVGPPGRIDSLQATSLVASADYTEADSLMRAALKVTCPTGFEIKRTSVDSVDLVVAD